ncbi:MAG: nucleoside deaminase [Thermoanaerobaculia bacterium]|nr:nucleoside deaminase [Thermoanaerobaculia bacterium]
MNEALALAEEAERHGEVPIGAVVVDAEGNIIGRGRNRREEGNPLGHAEIEAIDQAARAIGDWRLEKTTLYVTLEPCAMCAGAIVNARIPRLVFAAHDPKAGFCGSLGNLVQDERLNHRVEVTPSVGAGHASGLLQSFFRRLREKDRESGIGDRGSENR